MKIGFVLKWPLMGGETPMRRNFLGDEWVALALAKYLRRMPGVSEVGVYSITQMPDQRLDFVIYINDTPPNARFGKKHVLYLQNFYDHGAVNTLVRLRRHNAFDGYIFACEGFLKEHLERGLSGIHLPFGVDLEMFYPRPVEERYTFDVAYVGNNIKGDERNYKFLFPAASFNLGLFGNWESPKRAPGRSFVSRLLGSKPLDPKIVNCRAVLAGLSRGNIAYQELPMLYSSCSIALNFTASDFVSRKVVLTRCFEAMACGAIVISDFVPDHLSRCMLQTQGGPELVSDIKNAIENREMRESIKVNARDYVVKHCGISLRAQALFEYLHSL